MNSAVSNFQLYDVTPLPIYYKLRPNRSDKSLQIAYHGQEKNCIFIVFTDNNRLADITLDGNQNGKIVYKNYVLSGKVKARITSSVVIKFMANNDFTTAYVTDVRLLK